MLPDPALLQRIGDHTGETPDAIRNVSARLVETLGHFGVTATVIGTVSGPRVTRYELQLAPGIKVSRVASLKDDLAYALAATDIRVQAPIPGKTAVGVEVPNVQANYVSLGDIHQLFPQQRLADGVLARQGRLRQGRHGRPRAHGPPARGRHHRAPARAAASTRSSARCSCAPRRKRCA